MTEFAEEYAETDDLNGAYKLLRQEMGRLRGQAIRDVNQDVWFDPEAVAETIRQSSTTVEGHLVVFVANDFGVPRAFRPEGLELERQDEIRQAILANKYDSSNSDLDEIRRHLRAEHPGIHKAIVASVRDGSIRYHLPEGSNDDTNFLTVREMVGLVDYTTNSFQRDGLSLTY